MDGARLQMLEHPSSEQGAPLNNGPSLQQALAALRDEHQAFREEHEALCDCLAASGALLPAALQSALFARRNAAALRRLFQCPELAMMVGHAAGITATCRLAATSPKHGSGARACLPVLSTSSSAHVYVFGGVCSSGTGSRHAERFGPEQADAPHVVETWKALPPMPIPRSRCGAATIEGKLYVVGGDDSDFDAVASASCFDPAVGSWDSLPSMPTPRFGCAVAAAAGALYVVGGYGPWHRLAAVERFDCMRRRWERLPPLPTPRFECAAAALGGCVYVVGGCGDSADGMADARSSANERFDPNTGRWEQLPQMPTPRSGCAAAVAGGKLYVFGGSIDDYLGGEQAVVATVECYDPRAMKWQVLTPMPTARTMCAAVAVAGRLFVVGGYNSEFEPVASVECFDPGTESWRRLPQLLTPVACCAAASAWR
eukprot:gnl/TRDRNA2_/TRDRNA2_197227_c0_seq1.p1 gnl/TRDRNA2_/TRDRNA2_197227_c0~~gnl/TRDRNA2_/TRDRNA2_197227_c0_seq1.p1  ORF type:complete len:429 (+),score=66.61 gnl/TRDRNA2_/TRDRNA2_197227_c0_seq1:118-1404(+)